MVSWTTSQLGRRAFGWGDECMSEGGWVVYRSVDCAGKQSDRQLADMLVGRQA